MRCKKEEFQKSEYFHFYNHAVFGELLFRKNDDYLYFLDKFKNNLKKYPLTVVSYCLMPNHYHFFLRQDSKIPIYTIFSDSFTSYVLHYNSKYKRKGTLFQGPLQHAHVHSDNYFVQLCKYVHYNPKKAKLVSKLEDWKFSNYPEWIGIRNGKLFSNEFKNMYPDDFYDYSNRILEYEKYLEEQEFQNILLDS